MKETNITTIAQQQIERVIQKIKEIRKQKGYSIEYVATQLGMSPAGYLKIEKGATEISLKRIIELSHILETPLQDLLEIKTTYQYYQEIKEVNNGTGHYVVDQVNQFNRELVDLLVAEYKTQIASLKEELDKLRKEKR